MGALVGNFIIWFGKVDTLLNRHLGAVSRTNFVRGLVVQVLKPRYVAFKETKPTNLSKDSEDLYQNTV